jgi:DNA-binding winged helix-turn-helix (wHTH) protein/predicted Zn-dependent protease
MDVSLNETAIYLFGPFRLDPVRRQLSRDGVQVAVTGRVFDLLLCLVQHADRLVTKDELLAAVWRDRIVEESSLAQAMSALRKVLQNDGPGDNLIATIAGRGYRMAIPVRLETVLTESAFTSLATPDAVMAGVFTASPQTAAAPRIAVVPQTAAAPPTAAVPRTRIASGPVRLAAVCGVLVICAAGGTALLWHRAPPRRPLVVMTLAENLTPDPVFDRALGRALSIDLSQSPYLNLLSDAQVSETLALMTRPRDTKLTPELAREICNRNTGDVVVDGTIAALGTAYLLTLTATECGSGQLLGQQKAQVAGKDATITALDTLAGRLRGTLGETTASRARFDAPLLPGKTASFDALRAYSDGVYMVAAGKRVDAAALFQHAIDLDPDFAMAYASLASVQFNLHEVDLAGAAIARAYALRDQTNERQRLTIESSYQLIYRHDWLAAIRAFRLRTDTYPQDGAAWASLSNAENWIAQYQAAIDAGERAVQADPSREGSYVVLARALLHANEMMRARDVCEQGIARGVAGDDLREILLETAYGLHDTVRLQQQLDWARGKPGERVFLVRMALIAYSEGKVREGEQLFDRAAALSHQAGLLDYTQAGRARFLLEFGEPDAARAIISRLSGRPPSTDYLFAEASVGDEAAALAAWRAQAAKRPADTMLNDVDGPTYQAAIALRHNRPAEAISALAPALPYAMKTYDVPYLLGRIYLAANDGANAVAAFQRILDNPGVDPTLAEYNLAHLGLARALRLEHDNAGSAREYAAFLAAWKDADGDIPVLQQARAEADAR